MHREIMLANVTIALLGDIPPPNTSATPTRALLPEGRGHFPLCWIYACHLYSSSGSLFLFVIPKLRVI